MKSLIRKEDKTRLKYIYLENRTMRRRNLDGKLNNKEAIDELFRLNMELITLFNEIIKRGE